MSNPISPKVIAMVVVITAYLIGLAVVAEMVGLDLTEPVTAALATIIGAVGSGVVGYLTTDPKREVGP